MEIINKYFDDTVFLLKAKKFYDKRGFFSELYNKNSLKKLKIKDIFVQDNYSFSKKKGIIRGLHFQKPPFEQAKLIRVMKGKILDVVLDLRNNSPYYGKIKKFALSSENWSQLFIPPGFAHGFITLKNFTEVEYKVSNFYSKKHEITIMWDDPTLSINWTIHPKEILSQKDKNGILFNDLKSPFYL